MPFTTGPAARALVLGFLETSVGRKMTLKVVQAHFPSIPKNHVAAYYSEWRAERQGDDTGPHEVMMRCKACETLYTVPSGWHGAIALNLCGKCGLYDYILDAITDRILKTRPDHAVQVERREPCAIS